MAKSRIETAVLGALTNQQGKQESYYPNRSQMQNPFEVISDKMKNSTEIDPEFTGIARSVICTRNKGGAITFPNFQICTLYIEKGKVVKMEKSDMWQMFEAMSILELVNDMSFIHLNTAWEEGKALEK